MTTLIYAGNRNPTDATSVLEVASGLIYMGTSGVFTATEQNNLGNSYFLEAVGGAGVSVVNGPPTVQTITLYRYPGSGFAIAFGGQSTVALPITISAATLQTTLQALSSIGANNITVSGPQGGPYVCTFAGTLAGSVQTAMTVTGSALSTSPDLTSSQYSFNYKVKGPHS